MANKEMGRLYKEVVVVQFQELSQNLSAGASEDVHHGSPCPGRDQNFGAPDMKQEC
jgi:hypothetical protein